MKIANVFLMLCIINILWKDFKYVYGDGDGRRETGVAEDENIEIRGGTGQTREVEEEMIWRDSASSRYGRISEESDTDSDATSGDVQRFAPDDDYEADDDSENVGLEQQPDAESLVRASRTLSNPSVADFVEEIDTEGNTNHNQEQQHTVPTVCVVVQETIHEIADSVAEVPELHRRDYQEMFVPFC